MLALALPTSKSLSLLLLGFLLLVQPGTFSFTLTARSYSFRYCIFHHYLSLALLSLTLCVTAPTAGRVLLHRTVHEHRAKRCSPPQELPSDLQNFLTISVHRLSRLTKEEGFLPCSLRDCTIQEGSLYSVQ